MDTDIPSKFREVISKSNLTHRGPPVCYQLLPQKKCLDGETEAQSKIRRWTFGEKDHSKPNKTILMVGETGTGKSTLINAMVNYVMGVEWEDKVWFEIVEESKRSQSESQTSVITVYEMFGFEGQKVPFSLTIIDSPGYGDTRGKKVDKQIAEMLYKVFTLADGVHTINAVGLVVKAGTNRLGESQKYILDSVLSLFGKDLEKNIVALITHSDGGPETNALQALEDANVKCARDEKEKPVHFLFNNRQKDNFYGLRKERVMRNAWEITTDGLKEFADFLEKVENNTLFMTTEVIKERMQLEAHVNALQERIDFIEKQQDTIVQTKTVLHKHKGEMSANKNFEYTVEEPYKEKVSIKDKATYCTVCEENCHYPGCTIAASPYWCEVMTKKHCLVCSKKCHYTLHVKDKHKYDTKVKLVTKYVDDLKKEYETKIGNGQTLLSALEEDIKSKKQEKAEWVLKCYQCVDRLQDIALNTQSQSTHIHLDKLIQQLTEMEEMEKVQRLEKIRKQFGSVNEGSKISKFKSYLQDKFESE